MMSDLNMSHGKMSDFASFPLFGFNLVIKLKIAILKVIKILCFLMKKKMTSDSNMPHEKFSDFCFTSIVPVHFSHKTEKFRFLKSFKYFNTF